MTILPTPIEGATPITRIESRRLAATEYQRMLDALHRLSDEDWSKPTDCPAWTVRDLCSHVLGGIELFASLGEFGHQMRLASKDKSQARIDAMTALQVRERAHLSTAELLARAAAATPRAARARARIPRPLRAMPMREEVDGVAETWKLGYLLDVILTRDVWMHRVDLARATGDDLVLDAGHDGRLVADVVAEWARRHDQPFVLHLRGPAGGDYRAGEGGERLDLDAVEFCRILSGRGSGQGLLRQQVPF